MSTMTSWLPSPHQHLWCHLHIILFALTWAKPVVGSMSLVDSTGEWPHRILTVPFLLLLGRLELPSSLPFHLCHSRPSGACLRTAFSGSTALGQVESQNCLKIPFLCPRLCIFPLGCSPVPLCTHSLIHFPLPKHMGLTRYPMEFWDSYLWSCSGVLAWSRFQEDIRESRSPLLARWIFLSWNCMGLGCQNGVDMLIWGHLLISDIGRVQGSGLSVITTDLWAWALWVDCSSALSCFPSSTKNICARDLHTVGHPCMCTQFICPLSPNSYLVISGGKMFPSSSLPSLYCHLTAKP